MGRRAGSPDLAVPARWRLLAAVEEAGAIVCRAEAKLAGAESFVRRADAVVCRVRQLAEHLGVSLSPVADEGTGPRAHMSIRSFARHMGWGEKRMRRLVRTELTEGQHFHRNGGGKRATYVLHVKEAESFVRGFSARAAASSSGTTDELARWRARVALEKRGAK
jgi:hypothetical protein